MKALLPYLSPHKYRIFLEMFIKFLATIMDLLLPFLLSKLINDIAPLNQKGTVYVYGGLMILCALLCYIFNVTANRMSTSISKDITLLLRQKLYSKTLSLTCKQMDDVGMSSLNARLTSDTYNVHQFIDRMQRMGVRAPILLIGGIFSTLMLDPVLTLVLIVTLPILYFVVTGISRKGVPLYEKVQFSLDKLVLKVQENMKGIRVIKALSKTEYEKEQFDHLNQTLSDNDQHAGKVMATSSPAISFILNFGLTLVILVGAFRVQKGTCMPGTIIAFLNYFIIILNAVMAVTRLFVLYSKGIASFDRIENVLHLKDNQEIIQNTHCTSSVLEMQNVSFSYNKKKDNVQNISFALKKGQTLGILGATGSGKSTLMHLLLRLYDVDKGCVLLQGKDIKSYEKKELYKHFGVVFQNDYLFSSTIKNNIDFYRNLSDEQIMEALQSAQGAFVFTKKEGMMAPLSIRSQNLSGGQKQRLLIARAIVSKPDVLLLDDCSSALDYQTDAYLRKALKTHLKDSVKVIVSQRISSIKDADQIILMDNGCAIEQGTHEELAQSSPLYNAILNTQMGERNAQ